jgi:hypothetical protein
MDSRTLDIEFFHNEFVYFWIQHHYYKIDLYLLDQWQDRDFSR